MWPTRRSWLSRPGLAYPVGNVLSRLYRFEPATGSGTGRAQVTMDGNQALAYGLIAAGVRHGAGYPITPWSSVMEILRSELPKYGGLFVQAEDESGRGLLALGFSYAGHLAVTAAPARGFHSRPKRSARASMAERFPDCRQRSERWTQHRVADQRRTK